MKTKYIAILACSLLALASCIQDLDTLPMNEWDETSESAYKDSREDYIQGLSKLYYNFTTNDTTDLLVDDPGSSELVRAFWSCQEVPTDEVKCIWSDPWVQELGTNTWNDAENTMVYAVFVRTLQGIAFANEYLRQTAPDKLNDRGVSESLKKEIDGFRAEAKFLRAYFYWMAMDLFGDVPYSTEDTKFGADAPKQKKRADVYNEIVSDLEALAIDPNMPEARSNRPRADKGAVLGLLARVYLNAEVYAGKEAWTECKNTCEKIFALGYTLCPNYEDLFRGDNGENPNAFQEFLFYANYDDSKAQSWGGTTFLTCASVETGELTLETDRTIVVKDDTLSVYSSLIGMDGAWKGLHTHEEFIKIHFAQSAEPTWGADGQSNIIDKRGQLFSTARRTKGSFSDLQGEEELFYQGYGCYKYNNIPAGESGEDFWIRTKTCEPKIGYTYADIDFPLIRLGEIYLTYAEACAHLDAGAEAQVYVDRLTERAGLDMTDPSRVVPSSWNDEAVKWFREERARELFWEGHRRTDLIRYDSFSSNNYSWPFKNGNANAKADSKVEFSSRQNLFSYPVSQLSVSDWYNPYIVNAK